MKLFLLDGDRFKLSIGRDAAQAVFPAVFQNKRNALRYRLAKIGVPDEEEGGKQ